MDPRLINYLRCYSILPERIQRHIRQRRNSCTLAWHKWDAHDSTILVCKKAAVLDAQGMGTVVHRVAIGISKSTNGECKYTDLGDSLCNCNTAVRCGGCGDMGFGTGENAGGNGKDEGE